MGSISLGCHAINNSDDIKPRTIAWTWKGWRDGKGGRRNRSPCRAGPAELIGALAWEKGKERGLEAAAAKPTVSRPLLRFHFPTFLDILFLFEASVPERQRGTWDWGWGRERRGLFVWFVFNVGRWWLAACVSRSQRERLFLCELMVMVMVWFWWLPRELPREHVITGVVKTHGGGEERKKRGGVAPWQRSKRIS